MILTFPVMADHTFSVLSSEPLTILLPQNSKHVITWSSWPFKTWKYTQTLMETIITIDIRYSAFSNYVQKPFIKNNQWTDAYGPSRQITS